LAIQYLPTPKFVINLLNMRGLLGFVLTGLVSLASAAVLPSVNVTPATPNGLERRVVGPGKVTGNTAVHDPTMCKDGAGKYWVFSTGTGIEIRTSTDRTAFTYIGNVFPNGNPAATNTFTGGSSASLWAPDCHYVNNQFRLFYSASTFGSQKVKIIYTYARLRET
jgi:beta-xylosidase